VSNRDRSLYLFRLFRFILRGIKCANGFSAIHTIGCDAHASGKCAYGRQLSRDVQQGSRFRGRHQFGDKRGGAVERLHAL